MPFNNDDTDYEALKQERSNDRQSIRDLKDAFSLNVGSNPDRLLAILQGKYKPPSIPGEPDRITREVSTAEFSRGVSRKTRMSDVDDREEGGLRRVGGGGGQRHYASNDDYAPMPTKYAEVLDTLDRFKFSSDPDRRKKQMKIVSSTLRTALQRMILEEVAVNTKQAFKGHAERVVEAPGGLKVYFNFNDERFTVIARGGFHGDETICMNEEDDSYIGRVVRIESEEDWTDLSSSFDITIREGYQKD